MTNSGLYNPRTGMTQTMSYYLLGAGIIVVVFIFTIISIVYWMSNKIKNKTDDVYELVKKNRNEASKNFMVVDRKLTESSKSLNEKIDENSKKPDEHISNKKHLTDTDIQKKINPLENKINVLDTKQKVKENNMNAHLKSPHVSKSYIDDKLSILDDQFKTIDDQYKRLNTRVESNSGSILQMNVHDSISSIQSEMTSHKNDDTHLTPEQIDNLKSLNEFESRLAELEQTVGEISEEN